MEAMRNLVGLFLFLLIGLGIVACTSARKVSRSELRDPYTVPQSMDMGPAKLSVLREQASRLNQAPGCSKKMVRLIHQLSLERWPRRACPEAFVQEIAKALNDKKIAGEEHALLESLQKINCQGQGLLSRIDGGRSLEDGLRNLLLQDKFADSGLGREVAQEKNLYELRHSLQQILNENIALEKKIALQGEYLLTEENLNIALGLVRDACQLKNVHNFSRDMAMLMAMEQDEKLIIDPQIRQNYSELRKLMQQIFDKNIKSFF